jgi:hypothetical protein
VPVPTGAARRPARHRANGGSTGAPQRGLAIVAAVAVLLALTGCQSPLDACRKAHPADPAAARACFQTVLQQQNARLDRLHASEYRGRD